MKITPLTFQRGGRKYTRNTWAHPSCSHSWQGYSSRSSFCTVSPDWYIHWAHPLLRQTAQDVSCVCSCHESTLTGWGRGKDWDMNSFSFTSRIHFMDKGHNSSCLFSHSFSSPRTPASPHFLFLNFLLFFCSFVFVCSIASKRMCWGCQGFTFHWDEEQSWECQDFFCRRYETASHAPQITTKMVKTVHVHESSLLITCCLLSWFVILLFQMFWLSLMSFLLPGSMVFCLWLSGSPLKCWNWAERQTWAAITHLYDQGSSSSSAQSTLPALHLAQACLGSILDWPENRQVCWMSEMHIFLF